MVRHLHVFALAGCVTDPPLFLGGSGFTSGPTTDTSDATNGSETTRADASSSDGTGSTTSTRGDPSVGFIPDPDGRHPAAECSIFAEDCPAGEKCMPWANDGGSWWNALRCVPIAPDPSGVGEPCTVEGNGVSGIDDCELHAMCWNVDPDTNMGTCVAFCVGPVNNPTCLDPVSRCVFGSDGILHLCLPMCHPLAPDCLRGEVCVGVEDEFTCAPDASGDMGAAGDPCEFVNVCDPGLACVHPSTVPGCAHLGCCSAFCPIPDDTGCLAGQACLPWFADGEAPPGYEDVGICMLP